MITMHIYSYQLQNDDDMHILANILVKDRTIKHHDFNKAQLLKYNIETKKFCRFLPNKNDCIKGAFVSILIIEHNITHMCIDMSSRRAFQKITHF